MHTYIRLDAGGYSVGSWQISLEGHSTFVPLFDVPDAVTACRAVSMLNGAGTPFWNEIKITKEH
jgi:hypothetical protein